MAVVFLRVASGLVNARSCWNHTAMVVVTAESVSVPPGRSDMGLQYNVRV